MNKEDFQKRFTKNEYRYCEELFKQYDSLNPEEKIAFATALCFAGPFLVAGFGSKKEDIEEVGQYADMMREKILDDGLAMVSKRTESANKQG